MLLFVLISLFNMCASAIWRYAAGVAISNIMSPVCFKWQVRGGGRQGEGWAWREGQIRSISLHRSGQCVGKAAHCGGGIIKIFSAGEVLNGGGGRAPDDDDSLPLPPPHPHMSAGVPDKHKSYLRWRLNE